MVLRQKSVDALDSYGQLVLDNDIPIMIVLFITILKTNKKVLWFVMKDSWNSRRIDIIVKATKFI